MPATLSCRPATTEPRYHDAGHCLPAVGNRPWRRLQRDAAPIADLDRGVRNGRNDCTAVRAQDQTRLAPRSRMAWANPHGLRYRRRLRVPGQDLPFADQRSGARGGDGESAVKPERMIPMNSPAKLTDTQFAMLSEASQRKDRCLIPPKTLKAAGAQKVATKLLKAGLVREIKAKTGAQVIELLQ